MTEKKSKHYLYNEHDQVTIIIGKLYVGLGHVVIQPKLEEAIKYASVDMLTIKEKRNFLITQKVLTDKIKSLQEEIAVLKELTIIDNHIIHSNNSCKGCPCKEIKFCVVGADCDDVRLEYAKLLAQANKTQESI